MNIRSLTMRAGLLVLLLTASAAQAQPARVIDWVEDAPASDNSKIALGFPVPVPVDTPLPFDGFRSYNGLHTRHQDLAATTDWVHPHELGATRAGRTIWAYQLGDGDRETVFGTREHAFLANGGIHAREWQSPEVTTGILELLATADDDRHLISYLRDNANIIVIPVLNVDGFLQTQRTPDKSWMGTDPGNPEYSPRDGRMRRKNMLDTDEDFFSPDDHLWGVDLNRNNGPFWATNPDRSSGDRRSIVHHGAGPHSEPETQAMAAAVALGPADKLAAYTDLHSFSQVHFWIRTLNDRLTPRTQDLLRTFSDHHEEFDAGKAYTFAGASFVPRNQGIGLTSEYFAETYDIPSWTLEIEPSNGRHPGLPGQGADYGGLGRNGHDGFILPESEIRRVRTELAQSFAVAYYQQAGPPAMTAFRVIDKETGATVFTADWDVIDARNRELHSFQAQPLQLGREYLAWAAWDKPMRWREDGEVTWLPGQSPFFLNLYRQFTVGGDPLNVALGEPAWRADPGGAPGGFMRYRDDAMAFDLTLPSDDTNLELLNGATATVFGIEVHDMTSITADADPSTVAIWEDGGWSGYEDSDGADLTDIGGWDRNLQMLVTDEVLDEPFVIEPGMSAAWFDPARSGEGFLLEILSETTAGIYWFTYDTEGEQDWYYALGEIDGNRIVFPELIHVNGGEFGPGFDPEKVVNTVVGSMEFIWSSCNEGMMSWVIDGDGGERRQGRMDLDRLTTLMGFHCGRFQPGAPVYPEMRLSGSWFDPSHSGEGYVLQILSDRSAIVFWFSFDAEGNNRWFYGQGSIENDVLTFNNMLTTRGGIFGEGFDPSLVEQETWGRLVMDLDCDSGTADFEPVEEGFPPGRLDLERLTYLIGSSCQ